jgi:hypothetical protein
MTMNRITNTAAITGALGKEIEMNKDSKIVSLCNEAIANARMGYLDSACLVMDEALRLHHERHFNAIVESIAPALKGEAC